MDAAGRQIEDLQQPPGPPPASYSALVSNFRPGDDWVKRMLDVGIDAFFGSANDLVVPSEGGCRSMPAARRRPFRPSGSAASDPEAISAPAQRRCIT
jgi:hypothetical protein